MLEESTHADTPQVFVNQGDIEFENPATIRGVEIDYILSIPTEVVFDLSFPRRRKPLLQIRLMTVQNALIRHTPCLHMRQRNPVFVLWRIK